MNSCRKGKDGEREFARFLTDLGFPAHRGQQHAGGADSPDVICPALTGRVHFEVKRTETLNIHKAMEQAMNDAFGTFHEIATEPVSHRVPAVASRRNRDSWLITIPAHRLVAFCRAVLAAHEPAQLQPEQPPRHD